MTPKFYSKFKLLFLCLNSIGIIPFKLTPTGCKKSNLLLIWSFILLLATSPIAYFFSPELDKDLRFGLAMRIVCDMLFFIHIVCVASPYLRSVFYHSKLIKLFDQLALLEHNLAKIGHISYQNSFRYIVTSLILDHVFLVVGCSWSVREGGFIKCIYTLSGFLQLTGSVFALRFYSLTVLILQEYLKMINTKLEEIAGATKQYFIVESLTQFASTIDCLKRMYCEIYRANKAVDDNFSFITLFGLANNIVFIMIVAYGIVKLMAEVISPLALTGLSIVVVKLLCELLSVIWACESTYVEASRTTKILSTIKLETKESLLKISNFQLQLIHQKISFTTYELWTIDESLLCSVFASILSYLVIILQLDDEKIPTEPPFPADE